MEKYKVKVNHNQDEALKNAKVRAEYEALRPEFELVIALIKARKAAKISQVGL